MGRARRTEVQGHVLVLGQDQNPRGFNEVLG